jgi:exonuclease V
MLHDEIFYDAEAEPTLPELAKFQPKSPITDPAALSHESCAGDLIRYNSLRELVHLLQAELALTFPQGADSIGPLVKVEYRSRGHGSDDRGADSAAGGGDEDVTAGTVFGQSIFWVNDDTLELYLRSDLEWWKGEREPRGVEIEEAQKCRSCEFAEGCAWRKSLDEELLSRTREKLAAARTNSVG